MASETINVEAELRERTSLTDSVMEGTLLRKASTRNYKTDSQEMAN